ncbi:MAG TPA: response regulator [Chthoniobacteraceae bacterium]|nr:response regulator [Chthoniobacteraceae bacterium]
MKNRFLIVDDDALVCRATARMVEHLTGLPAECCADGDEALRLFQRDPAAFAAVVTDYEMPGMNGLELGDRLRALAPGLKMLLATGNPGKLNATDVKQHGFDCVLVKPYALGSLGNALREILSPDESPLHDAGWRSLPGSTLFFERNRGILPAVI